MQTNGLVPLHKLSQWLAYSLIEPLQTAGIAVTDIDGLTALPNIATAGCSSTPACWSSAIRRDAAREHDVASRWSSNGAR